VLEQAGMIGDCVQARDTSFSLEHKPMPRLRGS
jgi:hypothetical protein